MSVNKTVFFQFSSFALVGTTCFARVWKADNMMDSTSKCFFISSKNKSNLFSWLKLGVGECELVEDNITITTTCMILFFKLMFVPRLWSQVWTTTSRLSSKRRADKMLLRKVEIREWIGQFNRKLSLFNSFVCVAAAYKTRPYEPYGP